MAVEPLPIPTGPALLFAPDPPQVNPTTGRIAARQKGWRTLNGKLVRWYDDDAWGAVVQEIIVRYTLHGVSRGRLAREYPISERQIQGYCTGSRDACWRSYAAPVWRALGRLGLRPGRLTNARRLAAVDAIRHLSADILILLDRDSRPLAAEVRASLRLLMEVERGR